MRILALDVATNTGWAFYDTASHVSAIECGVVSVGTDAETTTATALMRDKRAAFDEAVTLLHNRCRPDLVVIESPLAYIKPNAPAARAPLLRAAGADEEARGAGGPNARAVIVLNQLFAIAETVARHKARQVIEVRPQTWQTILPKTGDDTKKRSLQFCHMLRIAVPETGSRAYRANAADAAAIAVWAQRHAPEARLLERAVA